MSDLIRNILKSFAVFCLILLVTQPTIRITQADEEEGWPREITAPNATVVIYQPQPETFEGNKLTARAAVAVTLNDKPEPVFGAIWVTAHIETDREARTGRILNVDVTGVRFPDATSEQSNRLTDLLETEIPKWELDISLDRLLTTLAMVDKEQDAAENLRNVPPRIVFSTEPAVLVFIDGEPELRTIENTKMMRVINTPYPIILETTSKSYYLSGGSVWYKAEDPKGPWHYIDTPPQEIAGLIQSEEDVETSDEASDTSTRIPKVIVSTEPAELLVSDGDPKYSPISGTDLLYMTSTENDILMEIGSQNYFILLSGRWFSGNSLDGPWIYVPSDSLPESFALIPFESVNGHLLTFVAGTEQAEEAILDNQVPQTNTVNRETASLEVTYDGKPEFEKIKGTDMEYAKNTSYSVLKIDGKYYCCHEAVWFEAEKPTGPWTVCVEVPDDVQEIPPESPAYNVKYVYVYDYTPEVVYVGYTPGYVGSYAYGPCVVYGTGYYYTPWWGPTHYYPRPATWGFHVRYNPWYGWSYGVSYHSGPFHLTVVHGTGHGGWWGPSYYRPYPYHSYHKTNIMVNRDININTGDININKRNLDINRKQANLYNRDVNRTRKAKQPGTLERSNPKMSGNKPNNLYADKGGNVHRRTEQGWEKRDSGNWSKLQTETADVMQRRPEINKSASPTRDRTAGANPSLDRQRKSLEQHHTARQRGAQRTRQAPQSRGRMRRR